MHVKAPRTAYGRARVALHGAVNKGDDKYNDTVLWTFDEIDIGY